jgi:hypothetical protein
MQTDDLILVSIDDHVVEPRDMFDRHVAGKWKDEAPRRATTGSSGGCSGTRSPARWA